MRRRLPRQGWGVGGEPSGTGLVAYQGDFYLMLWKQHRPFMTQKVGVPSPSAKPVRGIVLRLTASSS